MACNNGSFTSKVCDVSGGSFHFKRFCGSFQLWLVEVSLQKFVMLQVEVSISKGFVEVSSCGLWKFNFKSLWCFRWKFPFQKVLWKFPVVACGSLTSKVCDASGGSFQFKRFCGSFQLSLVEVSLRKFMMLQVEVSISKGFVKVSSCGLWKFHFKSLWCFRWKFHKGVMFWVEVASCGLEQYGACLPQGSN